MIKTHESPPSAVHLGRRFAYGVLAVVLVGIGYGIGHVATTPGPLLAATPVASTAPPVVPAQPTQPAQTASAPAPGPLPAVDETGNAWPDGTPEHAFILDMGAQTLTPADQTALIKVGKAICARSAARNEPTATSAKYVTEHTTVPNAVAPFLSGPALAAYTLDLC